ncbi:MAG TPA: SPOR domain-containing protein [Chitinophagaceae bacterium]|jgi:hypothetical protein|nr:SPOR domain-containing protein [Chitinophagaceae bacterium]
MKKNILFCALFFSFASFAQDSTWKVPFDSTGTIMVHKDPRLDALVKKQIEINDITSRDARMLAKGFRLLVINTNDRDEAIAAKSKVYTYFPELKPYLIYQSPYFRLKVGNFKARKDAEAYQEKMNKYFPKGVFVVNDIIEVNAETDPLEQDDNMQ